MAIFKVTNTFRLETIDYFVIAGEIISGKIEKGMYLNYKNNGNNIIRLPIAEINFLDKRINGNAIADMALCIKADKNLQNILNRLHLKGNIFNIKHFSYQAGKIIQNELIVTSFVKDTHLIHTRSVNTKAHFLPGGLYSIKSPSELNSIRVSYIGKHLKYCKFQYFGNPGTIPQGTKVMLEPA